MTPSQKWSAVVVGGTGFLGRHVCAALARRGHTVLATGRKPNVKGFPRAEFRVLDMLTAQPGELTAIARSAQVVVNAAGDSWEGSEEAMTASHGPLVERLVEATAAMDGTPRLIQLGSVHEYGPVPPGTVITEDRPEAPVSVFARTKLASARTVLDATRAGLVDGCVLRVTNVCGPGTPRGSFLGALAEKLLRAGADAPASFTVVDDHRDFVDVRDVAEAVALAAAPGAPVTGRVVNIGQGRATALRDLVDWLVAASAVPPHLVREEKAPVTSFGGNWTQSDIGLARELLGWSPHVPLPSSVRDLWTAAAGRPTVAAARTEGQ
ncbi:NAD-dependent epimerase/dehydratase family protein [Streptomyces sp. NPDC053367]|uniref:NAD-dependent epimerase/dehydratase family protein n=1 Tax=Streptomyces sp. NPDC053367 TaxID=3365700 RepID=UPI0037D2AE2E